MRHFWLAGFAIALTACSSGPATVAEGRDVYAARCATCHGADGKGGDGTQPPLAGNPIVTARDATPLIHVVKYGLDGPLFYKGHVYELYMPNWSSELSNREIASVLSYVRSAWGNRASGVSTEQVAADPMGRCPTYMPCAHNDNPDFAYGSAGYEAYNSCYECHGAHGEGTMDEPPLANNPVVTGDPEKLIRIVKYGVDGKMWVNGQGYNGFMFGVDGRMSDRQVADALSYIRGAWGNHASAIDEAQVRAVSDDGTAARVDRDNDRAARVAAPVRPSQRGSSADRGSGVYTTVCMGCHRIDGQGVLGLYPPLAGNPLVTRDPRAAIGIVMNGQHGRTVVDGDGYDGEMPAWGPYLNDEQIAAVLTYIRGSWGNNAAPVLPRAVRIERKSR